MKRALEIALGIFDAVILIVDALGLAAVLA